jgi:hypothetical protein
MGGPGTRRVPIDLRGLSSRADIFTVSNSSPRDPNIKAWFSGEPAELKSMAKRWFLRMRQCGNDVRESMHDGCPVACIENAPFGYVNSFKNHVNVGFFNGADLEDPGGLLEGSGKRMRHVKLQPGGARDDEALGTLIGAAYRDMKRRLKGIA